MRTAMTCFLMREPQRIDTKNLQNVQTQVDRGEQWMHGNSTLARLIYYRDPGVHCLTKANSQEREKERNL